jgi:hypothetical protein
MHNVRMKSPGRLLPLALVAALALSGCGGDDGGDDGIGGSTRAGGDSTISTNGPDGAGSAGPQPGDELTLGEDAPLAWQPKQGLDGQVEVSVDRMDQSTMKDFSAFKLDRAMKRSTPYYVHVSVENTGTANLSGVELPIFLDNGSDVLFPSARITSSFEPCPSRPLPKGFTEGKRAKLCLVFLAAEKTKLQAIAMRPTDDVEPVTWTGDVTRPAKPKKKQPQNG